MPRPKQSRWMAIGNAFSGWLEALRSQENTRIHGAASLLVIGMGIWLGLDRQDWALIALSIGIVWTAELFNTAIEAVVDLISPAQHPLARVSKDVSAAAVLTAAATSVVLGLLILGPPLWEKLIHLLR